MGGGAWPFLVGGVICLVNSVNERDLNCYVCGEKIHTAIVMIVATQQQDCRFSSRRKREAITGL